MTSSSPWAPPRPFTIRRVLCLPDRASERTVVTNLARYEEVQESRLTHTVDVDREDPLLAAVLIDLEVTSLG